MTIVLDLWPALSELATGIFRTALLQGRQYLVVTGIFLALYWWLSLAVGGNAKLQAKQIAQSQVRRELLYSLFSIVIFASIMPLLFALGLGQYMRFYKDVDTYGWPYLFLSIILMMIIQDTYFYWTHRLMHRRSLFRLLHRTHHLSSNPNPLSTYSIDPLEALINYGAILIILFLIPTTGLSLFIFSWLNVSYAVYAHLGYEIFPRSITQHWFGRWINTSMAHNRHHANARYNFGWYFLFWDRMMGTLAPDYAAQPQAGATAAHRPEVVPGQAVDGGAVR